MASSDQERHTERVPEAIREFLAARITVGEAMLPALYPEPESLDALQIGFRSDGVTGKSLVSEAAGCWQPGWYVVALNGLDDPFFIDIGDEESGYRVYHAPHGAGLWNATLIAPSLSRFAEILSGLQGVRDDSAQFSQVLKAETDLSSAFWREVQIGREEAEGEKFQEAQDTAYDPKDYESGHLVVTDPGPHKLQVVRIISKAQGISLKEALALAADGEFRAGSGLPVQLRRLRDQLEALGSTVEFRPSA